MKECQESNAFTQINIYWLIWFCCSKLIGATYFHTLISILTAWHDKNKEKAQQRKEEELWVKFNNRSFKQVHWVEAQNPSGFNTFQKTNEKNF